MNKEFVTYEQALALKELGFDEPCFGYYYTLNGKDWKFAEKSEYYRLDDEINIGGKFSLLAPLYQQAFRWFREKEYYSEITTECTQVDGSVGFSWRIWKPWTIEEWSIDKPGDEWSYETYEEAEQACLNKLIEMVKTK